MWLYDNLQNIYISEEIIIILSISHNIDIKTNILNYETSLQPNKNIQHRHNSFCSVENPDANMLLGTVSLRIFLIICSIPILQLNTIQSFNHWRALDFFFIKINYVHKQIFELDIFQIKENYPLYKYKFSCCKVQIKSVRGTYDTA
jgi:hypothetical protein